MPDVRGAFGQDDAEIDQRVGDALGHFGAFEEGHGESVGGAAVGEVDEAQHGGQIVVPAEAELVFPAAEDRVAGFELEVGFAGGEFGWRGPVARGGDVANVVGEVGVNGAGAERVAEFAERDDGEIAAAVEVLGRPGYAGEGFGEDGAGVVQDVAFFGREVVAPVGDFQVAFERGV